MVELFGVEAFRRISVDLTLEMEQCACNVSKEAMKTQPGSSMSCRLIEFVELPNNVLSTSVRYDLCRVIFVAV